MNLPFSRKHNETITPEAMKAELKDLLKAEASLWDLVSNPHSRLGIPSVLESMRRTLQYLIQQIQKLEHEKREFFQHYVSSKTSIAIDFEMDFNNLEKHLAEQINQLNNILEMSENKVRQVLDLGKVSNVSKTSSWLQQLIQKCESEIDKLLNESHFVVSGSNVFSQLLNNYGNNWQGFPVDIVKARVQNPHLFNSSFLSNAAVIYHSKYKKNGLFKLVIDPDKNKIIQELKGKPEDNRDFIEGSQDEYDSLQVDNKTIFEFDRRQAKYNDHLTKDEVLNHPFWLALVQGDKDLLGRYFDAGSSLYNRSKGMEVFLSDPKPTIEWAVVGIMKGSNNFSRVSCYSILNNYFGYDGCFLLKKPIL